MLSKSNNANRDITPEKAIEILKQGNKRFVENKLLKRDLLKEARLTSTEQNPFAIVLNCIDSRVHTALIFDMGIGDMFSIRIPGNVVNDDIIGSMEFACKIAGTKLIVVLGHTSCGAVKGACDRVKLGKLTGLLKKIEPAINSIKTDVGVDRSSENLEFVNRVVEKNVEISINNIRNQSPILNLMIEDKEIGLVGAIYDISTGKVKFGSNFHSNK
jgi:carbonic anhydrase